MIISTERVNNAKAYLEAMGVKANMETKSFGESRPATASENEQNAVFNRRVQVRVYVK